MKLWAVSEIRFHLTGEAGGLADKGLIFRDERKRQTKFSDLFDIHRRETF